nr:hypothetical protein [Tanacetum cinerariifolium]
MLRLELHITFILAVGKLTLGLLSRYTSCFSRVDDNIIDEHYQNLSKYGLHTRFMRSMNIAVDQTVPAFLKELIGRVLRLLVLLLELNRFEILLDEHEEGRDTSSTQGKVSNIPMVLSWGGSISPDGFLPSILLLAVSIAVVVIVAVIVIVVVIGEAVTFPSLLQGNPPMKTSIIFLEFGTIVGQKPPIPGIFSRQENEFHQDKASSVRVPVANFTLQTSVQLLWENTDSVRSNQRMSPTSPSVHLKLKACASRATATLSATSFLITAWVKAGTTDVDVFLGDILSTFTRQHSIRMISQVICTMYGKF